MVSTTPRPLYPLERDPVPIVQEREWAGLDGCGKPRPTRIRSPNRSARSESLCRLRYSGPRIWGNSGMILTGEKRNFSDRNLLPVPLCPQRGLHRNRTRFYAPTNCLNNCMYILSFLFRVFSYSNFIFDFPTRCTCIIEYLYCLPNICYI